MNRKSKKYSQETVGILYDSLRVVVSVWVWAYVGVCAYECVGYGCLLMCVCMSLSEATNAARCITGSKFVDVS